MLSYDCKNVSGTVTMNENGTENTFKWYQGNALMIVVREYEKDGETYHDLMWFFIGKDHARNCLGLAKTGVAKGHSNMFGENGITKLTINRKYASEWKTIVDLFTKAFPEIEITIAA